MKDNELEIIYSDDNPAIEKDDSKCIQCGYCVRACRDEVTVLKMYDINQTREPVCIHCGQCANLCPTEAVHEKFDYLKLKELLSKKDFVKVISIAPAVRVAIGEAFSLGEENYEGKIVAGLKRQGFDYVFDVTFGADLTIMEEAMELVNRIKNNEKLPMFTSCCPAWVRYAEIFYPEFLSNLSSCKSPITMQSSMIKTYFAEQEQLDVRKILNVVVAPCTAKKAEVKRDEVNRACEYFKVSGISDTDYVITTRELISLFRDCDIDFKTLPEEKFSSPLGKGSSAGLIFGKTGGVMEAALRTAYYFLNGKDLDRDAILFQDVRGTEGVREASVNLGDVTLKVAVINGMKNAVRVLDKIKKGEVFYHFVEVMSCSFGCVGGGGQPKLTLLEMKSRKNKRLESMEKEDSHSTIRLCHQNPEIKEIYEKFLDEPNSERAEELLHTTFVDRSYLLGGGHHE